MKSHPGSTVQTKLLPPHQLTTMAAGHGSSLKCGSCRCGWKATAADSDQVAELFRDHLDAQHPVLL